MKLKKLLAAVTAAALAVTTMAVTSFTASAETASGTHTFASPDTFYYTDDTDKLDYKEYSLTQEQIGTAIGQPGAYVNGVESITINYEASDDISGVSISHNSDEANSYWATESLTITSGTGTVTTQKPFSVSNGSVGFQINVNDSDTNLSGNKTLKINSVTFNDVTYVSEKIDAGNFTFSELTNTDMTVGDSFTIAYDSTGTPASAAYSIKYEWNDGSDKKYGNAYFNGAIDNSNESVLGVKVTSAVSGNITTYTFTATGLSEYAFEVKVEASALGDFSDIQYLWFGSATSYKVTNDGNDNGEFEISINPETKTIAVNEDFTVTVLVTGTTPELENVDGSMQATYDDTLVSVDNGTDTDDGMVYTITGVAAGTTTVDFEWTPDESTGYELETPLIASCEVTVTDGTTPPAADTSTWKIVANGFTTEWGGWTSVEGTEGKLDFTCTIQDIMEANSISDISEFGGFIAQAWFVPLGDKVSYAIRIEAADGTVKTEDSGTYTVVVNGGDGANKDDPNYSLKQYAIESCGGNLEFAPTDVLKIAVAAGETIPTIPSDDEPTPPVTGSAIWEGNTDMGTEWSANVQIAANKFADIKAGDTLKYTFTCEPDAQMKIASLAEGWPVIPGPNPDPEWGIINISDTSFSFVLTAADVTALKEYGMAVSGKNYTLTKVELVPKAEPKPPVDPDHEHTPATAWSSDSTGHWHACSGCSEKLSFDAHTSDGGTVTTPATATTTGTRTYKCTVCEYVIRTETIPATGTGDTPAPWIPSPGVAAPVVPTTGANNGSVPTVNGQSGWEAVSAEIVTSSDGDKIVVNMNSATKVPSTILGDIEGKDVDLVLNMGRGITWTINGLSVTSRKTIDLDITKNTRHIPDEVVDSAEGSHKRQITLDHKGTFGCTAALTYSVGTKYNGLYANLFYYNPKTEQLEFADCSLVSGGNAKFMFTHASDYLITISDEPLGEFEDVSSAAGIASDGGVIGNGAAISAVLAVIVLGFGIVVYRKRRHN